MNTYDQKHLRLLTLISAGDWPSIVIADLDEIRTLSVCGYIQVSANRSESHQITLLPEGRDYLEHLLKLKASENDGAYQPTHASPALKPSAAAR
jgi:hypothetical protein